LKFPKFKFTMRDEYLYTYEGLDAQFWDGMHGHPPLDFIEQASLHRTHGGTKTMSFDAVYRTAQELDAYYNDPIFNECPVNPYYI